MDEGHGVESAVTCFPFSPFHNLQNVGAGYVVCAGDATAGVEQVHAKSRVDVFPRAISFIDRFYVHFGAA
jgi:hypothetical protein